MLAFLLTIALFSFFAFTGHALLTLCLPRMRVVQRVLLSPALGVAITILPVYIITRWNIPVKEFGLYLFFALLGFAISIHIWKRPFFPVKQIWPFAIIMFASLLLVGWPMLLYNFSWLSYVNDDMTNYALGAQRFLNHGFFEVPPLNPIVQNKDYSQLYWFMHASGRMRAGAELLLAWAWSVTGLNSHQNFMPVILALNLSLISATIALAARAIHQRKRLMLVAVFMALSPLISLGALYQLIGQVGGFTLLCGSLVLLTKRYSAKLHYRSFIALIPAFMMTGAILIYYPEALPFLGLTIILHIAYLALHNHQQFFERSKAIIIFLPIMIILFLGQPLYECLMTMFMQAGGGMSKSDLSTLTFPYYLMPKGLAAFLGIITLNANPAEPWVSLSILISIIMIILLAGSFYRQVKAGMVHAITLIVMVVLAGVLAIRLSDFGLFKLAMFAQPFLLITLAVMLFESTNKRAVKYMKIILAGILPFVFISQLEYVERSTGNSSGGLNEVPFASSMHITTEFPKLIEKLNDKGYHNFIIDTPNVSLAKLLPLYATNDSLNYLTKYWFNNIIAFGRDFNFSGAEKLIGYFPKNERFVINFEKSADDQNTTNGFMVMDYFHNNQSKLITTAGKQSLFNNYYTDLNADHFFKFILEPKNHLVFIPSDLGNHYFLGNRRLVSFYQLERDPMWKENLFASTGRHMVLMALNPDKKTRLYMELTSTILPQFSAELPQPYIHGEHTINTPIIGRGSARVVTDVVSFAHNKDLNFIDIDMGREAKQFSNARSGLMLVYGRDIPLDYRWLTTFGRDISLISDKEYQNFHPPSALEKFPNDLGNKQLEYSGIYEDGWISETSFFMLAPTSKSQKFVLKGFVPLLDNADFTTSVTIKIAGKVRAVQKLKVGDFTVDVPLTAIDQKQSKLRIDLQFNKFQRLVSKNPFVSQDGRITGAHIAYLGFSDEPVKVLQMPSELQNFQTDLDNKQLEYSGIYKDGWISNAVFVVLANPEHSDKFMLKGAVPQIRDAAFETTAIIKIGGEIRATKTLKVGDFNIELPLTAVEQKQSKLRIDLEFDKSQNLTSRNPFAEQDGRATPAHITYLGFSHEPADHANPAER